MRWDQRREHCGSIAVNTLVESLNEHVVRGKVPSAEQVLQAAPTCLPSVLSPRKERAP